MSELVGRLLIDGMFVPGRVRFEAGRITAVERLARVAEDAPLVAPGLIDLHVHGYAGCDPYEDLAGLSKALASVGTTAFLPTLFPDAPARLGKDAQKIWERREECAGGARVLGLHLEGPFVNPKRAGGLPADRLHEPSPSALRALFGSSTAEGRGIRQLTVAPELSGAEDMIRELSTLGVRTSLGHSVATASDAGRACACGARGATHLFNAMNGVHHRDASLANFALAEDALVCELIGDLVHVGPTAVKLALRARGPHGLALVSDALKGAGQPGAEFESHGKRCQVRGGAIYLVGEEPPRLTGAEACQLEAVRRLVKAGVVSAAEALTMASATPARALGLAHELGHLAVGARADLLVLDPQTLALRGVHLDG